MQERIAGTSAITQASIGGAIMRCARIRKSSAISIELFSRPSTTVLDVLLSPRPVNWPSIRFRERQGNVTPICHPAQVNHLTEQDTESKLRNP